MPRSKAQKRAEKRYQNVHKEELKLKSQLYNQKIRKIVLEFYGGKPPKCICCGESIIQFLSLDHKNNDGAEHRRSIGFGSGSRGYNIYPWVIRNNFPEIFQIMCYNCNFAKARYGKCPHKLQ
jgi:hypothetical protein